ncbi:DUF3139 domain-containing protein [Macrococcoides bohemicum]|uniref:DUF3139 domain-containing protein n=1 Tax=Macrococcoides bohemicum TaxID=1903056 RepID=UPI00165D7391|nr:DUF3139 domain-containing protein [Macrococcus bohemicus]MBC9875533.1 DUF3139 domain-containing protein [Macrococcus bohemicus]
MNDNEEVIINKNKRGYIMKVIKWISICILVFIILGISFKFIQGQVAYKKIDEIVQEKGWKDNVEDSKKHYSFKFNRFSKTIKFSDEPKYVYEFSVLENPSVSEIFDSSSYKPDIIGDAFEGNNVILDTKKAKHTIKKN